MPIPIESLSSPFLAILGSLFVLVGTVKAIQKRHQPYPLLTWLCLSDLGFVAVGLACGKGGSAGAIALLFFAGTARLLALQALGRLNSFARTALLRSLETGIAHTASSGAGSASMGAYLAHSSVPPLCGLGRKLPFTSILYALGMFAALGVSPFLTPDAKPLIMLATLSAGQTLLPLLLTAANVTGVILTVLAVHQLWLPGTDADTTAHALPDDCSEGREALPFFLLLLTLPLVLMGVFGHDFLHFAARLVGASIGETASVLPDTAATGLTSTIGKDITAAIGSGIGGLPAFTVNWHPAALIPFLGGFVVFALGLWRKEFRNRAACAIMALAVAAAFLSSTLTPLSRLFCVLVTGVGFLVTVYSCGYIHGHGERAENSYFALLLLMFGSLAGVGSANNLGGFFVFWELMTLSSYILVAHEGTKAAHAAAIKYYIMCGVAAAVMLPGLLALGAYSGTLDVAMLSRIFTHTPQLLAPSALTLVGLLLLVGFGVKAGLVPGHGWLPDAHPAAPSSISAPLSGILTKAGVFGLLQLFLGIFGVAVLNGQPFAEGQTNAIPFLGSTLSFFGALTMLYGEYMALRQQDIKRLFAYSTMGQVGEITMTLGLCGWLATSGALLHVVNHAVMKDLLFLCSGALILRAGGRNLSDLRGLGRAMPFTAVCMIIGLLSIMGLPPFAGFMSKYLMLYALASVSPFMAGLMLLASLAGCVYYMRIIRTLIFEPYSGPPVAEVPLTMRAPLAVLAALCLLMGLFPQMGLSLVLPVVEQLTGSGKLALETLPSLTIVWPSYTALLLLGAALPVLFRHDRLLAGRITAWILVAATVLVLLFGRNLDSLSFLFALIIPALGAINMFYATGYMEHSHSQWRFYSFFLCMTAGLTGVAASTDLFNFFLFWEIMSSWSLYFVIVHEENADALREGFKYFFFNMLGAAFLFFGVVLLTSWAGSAEFSAIREALPCLTNGRIALVIFVMATGFIMKAAQLPFRIDVQMHPATAPTPVSGYISSVLLKSALFGLAKLFLVLGGGVALTQLAGNDALSQIASNAAPWFGKPEIMHLTVWVGGITIVMAAGFAVFQSDVKRVLIYSTVSQLGYMVVGIALGSSLGVAGGLLHLVNHVLFKDLLFLVAGALILQTHKHSMNDMGGIGAKMPVTLAFFAIGALCVIGVPPSNGFTSKWIIYHALMEQGYVLVAILSLIGSVITLAYFVKLLHIAFLGSPSPDLEQVHEAPRSMLLPMGVLAAGCVLTSFFPGIILAPLNTVLTDFALPTLDVAPWGLASGKGAWNATATAVLFASAAYGGHFVLTRLCRNQRSTDVHTCGIPPDELQLRTTTRDIYSAPAKLLARMSRLRELL